MMVMLVVGWWGDVVRFGLVRLVVVVGCCL